VASLLKTETETENLNLNTKDFTYLLNKPYSVTGRQTTELEQILMDFPYLQSARAIHLKGLYNQDSFRYNTELKKTAAHTTDRSVLFDFITSEHFQSVQKGYLEEIEKAVSQISVTDVEVIQPSANKLEESIKQTIKEAGQENEGDTVQPIPDTVIEMTEPATGSEQEPSTMEVKLELGKPLEFEKSEKHSFQEWLQLSKLAPIDRENERAPEQITEPEDPKAKKLELIDKFIETNPKIVGDKNTPPPPPKTDRSSQDTSYLMTETLARVYLEQKKYSRAIQAYEILILKYPEKSVFFADRISDIKILQQNNN
jgi:hypothetical protein